MDFTFAKRTSMNQSPGKVGFHYYPDSNHFTERELQINLPVFHSLHVNWLVLVSSADRAIPEYFLSELIREGIEPIIQFPLTLDSFNPGAEIRSLVEAYARWGVKYIQTFNRPNARSSWPPSGWVQEDLVERYLDRFIPVAESIMRSGCNPVAATLEPGGNFWDTAFLKSMLQSLDRRGKHDLLDMLVLSVNGWTFDRPLTWGQGGPERWPNTRPYITPEDSEDQLGFNGFEWYQAIAVTVLQKEFPIFVMQAGIPNDPLKLDQAKLTYDQTKDSTMEIFAAAAGQSPAIEVPDYIKSVNFWLLTADEDSLYYKQAWFHEGHPYLPYAQAIHVNDELTTPDPDTENTIANGAFFKRLRHPIDHYLLIASGGQGSWEKQFARLIPYINKHHPTIGFSMDEALMASKITILGESPYLTKDTITRFKKSGCLVERMNDDGTLIAQ